MAFSLVYTGEHFVTDILVGWIYAAATVYFGSKLLDRWDARRLRRKHPRHGRRGPGTPARLPRARAAPHHIGP